jgi:hypothetical protein
MIRPSLFRSVLALLACLAPNACNGLICGDGTVETDGVCQSEVLVCGPGTVQSGNSCVLEDQIQCGDDTVLRGETCVSATKQYVWSPFEAGVEISVSQSFHGYFSHNGSASYAVDFPADEGTTITAVRPGIVRATRSDSDTGCGDTSCAADANYIVVDHGDGTFAGYWHLQYDGVDVEVGERVGAGHPIARSGNTGFSTGPHLHLQVDDVFSQSLPMRFEELLEDTGGTPSAGVVWSSANVLTEPDTSLQWSDCPADSFAHMGVELDSGTPCSTITTDESYTVSGTVFRADGQVMIAQWGYGDWDWDYSCYPLDDDGRFSAEVSWDSSEHWDDTWLMIAAADDNCWSFQSWATSIWVSIE